MNLCKPPSWGRWQPERAKKRVTWLTEGVEVSLKIALVLRQHKNLLFALTPSVTHKACQLPRGGSPRYQLHCVFSGCFVSSWAEKISRCEIFVVEPDFKEGAKRDLLINKKSKRDPFVALLLGLLRFTTQTSTSLRMTLWIFLQNTIRAHKITIKTKNPQYRFFFWHKRRKRKSLAKRKRRFCGATRPKPSQVFWKKLD